MPDFGLTDAIADALKAAKSADVMRPGERALAKGAAGDTAAAAARARPVAVAPPAMQPIKVDAPAAAAPPVPPVAGQGVQAPVVNPSLPPPDVPAPVAAQAAQDPAATAPAPAPISQSTAGAIPPTAAAGATEPPPQPAAPKAPPAVPAANVLPPAAQTSASDFLSASLPDFKGKLDLSHMPNVDTLAVPDAFKASLLKVADDNEGLIQGVRKGTVSDEQLIGLAQDMAVNRDAVAQALTREVGNPVERPAIALAARMIEVSNLGQLRGLAARVTSGNATSQELIQFQQQMQAFAHYRSQIAGAAAGAGRTVRAFGIPVGTPPEVLDHVASLIQQTNPDLQKIAAAIQAADTPAGVATIVNGSLWARSIKASANVLHRIFVNGILSGPTAWKILWNNNFNLVTHTADIGAAAAYRGMANLALRIGRYPTPEEGAELEDMIAHIHGTLSGFSDGLRVAGKVLKTGKSVDQMMRMSEAATQGPQKITEWIPEINNSMFAGPAHFIDTAIDAPGRVIGAVDDLTKTIGYRGWLTMRTMKAVRAGLSNGTLKPEDAESFALEQMQHPTEEQEAEAEAWAHRITFQTPWVEGGPGDKFQKFLTSVPVLRYIFPFMRTATNIFKQALTERTPYAFLSARVRADMAAGGVAGDIAKARVVTGTLGASMFAWMAAHDMITGDGPKNAQERAIWEADGHQPYSVRITNPVTGKSTWRSYMWFEPWATIMAVSADAVSIGRYIHGDAESDTMLPHGQMWEDAIQHIVGSVIENVGNKTFMQGAAQFAQMYNDPQRFFDDWADQLGAAMVPYSGFTKMLRNLQDPYLRQAYTLLDKIRDDLPTIMGVKGSKTLPSRLDIFGQPRLREGGNSIEGPLNPMPGAPAKNDPVVNELHDLMDRTRTVPIGMPSKRLALMGSGAGLQDGEGMQLTPSEYHDYVEDARRFPVFDNDTLNLHDKLAQVMRSPVYLESTPAERVEIVKTYQHMADKLGAAHLWEDRADFRERMQAWTTQMSRLKFGQ